MPDAAPEVAPALELLQDAAHRLFRPEVELEQLVHDRPLEPPPGVQHSADNRADALERRRCGAELVEDRQAMAEKAGALLLDACRRRDPTPPQPSFDEVDAVARKARIGRAQEREKIAAGGREPGEAQECEERPPERSTRQARGSVEHVGDTQGTEGGLERRAHALEGRDDDADVFRRNACAKKRQELFGDKLERGPSARGLEEAHGPAERRGLGFPILEEDALEVRERRLVVPAFGRQLLDSGPPVVGHLAGRDLPRQRGQVARRARERLEGGAPRLVREGDADIRPARERLEQPPLSAAQILEAVDEDRRAAPALELARDELAGAARPELRVPDAEAVELLPVGAVEAAELAAAPPRARRAQPRARRSNRRVRPRSRRNGTRRRGLPSLRGRRST